MRIILIPVPLLDRIKGKLVPIMMDKIRANPPLGVYLLASLLREKKFEVDILDLIAHGSLMEDKEVDQIIRTYDVVGISASSLSWPTARMLIEQIRRVQPQIPLILGGVHGSFFDNYILTRFPVNYIVRGEGERALPELLEHLESKRRIETIAGVSYRVGSKVIRNPSGRMLTSDELDRLPPPAFDLMPAGTYKALSIQSSRGCLFSCTFCAIPFHRTWRPLSSQGFVRLVNALTPYRQKTTSKMFSIVDDCFTFNAQRVIEIVQMIENQGIPFRATVDARCTDLQNEEVVGHLAKIANRMLVGAENGYPEGLLRIKKGITIEHLEQAYPDVERPIEFSVPASVKHHLLQLGKSEAVLNTVEEVERYAEVRIPQPNKDA